MAGPAPSLQIAARLHAQGKIPQAEAMYRAVLEHQPREPQALHLLGVTQLQQGRLDEAIDLIQQAISIIPTNAEFHNNLGIALDSAGRREEAATIYRRGIELQFNYPEIHNNLAGTLGMLGQIDEAIREYQTAVEQKPDYAEAWDNLGSTLRLSMRNEEALAAYDKAIELKPDFAYAHYNRGTLKLAMGDFAAGWEEIEWRWKCATFDHPIRDFGRPQWKGEDLSGKSILFHAEQGLGDTIHFARYASILAERGAKVFVEAQPELANLLGEVPGVSKAVPRGSELPEFDYHIPMMSVPGVVGTTRESIPADMPYILPPAAAHEKWRTITRADARAEGQRKLRVGLVWSGNPRSVINRRRAIDLKLLAPLGEAPNIRFYSLQLGEAAGQIKDAPFPIIDHTDKLEDFIETAGMIANIDLVICVDTVVAHLAGAMNARVWMLTYTPSDWRWMIGNETSPWYPSLKLFRQAQPWDWSAPVERIAGALKQLGKRLGG